MDDIPHLSSDSLNALQRFLAEQGIHVESDENELKDALKNLMPNSDSEDEENETVHFNEELFVRAPGKEPHELRLKLIATHHSLLGHKLWNSSRLLADIFDSGEVDLRGKCVLELGAGAGLPSLICALNGAEKVVLSDYENDVDHSLVQNVQRNVDSIKPYVPNADNVLFVRGLIWGYPVHPLLEPLDPNLQRKFDIIILADLIFNRSEHAKLLKTCYETLAPNGTIWFAYGHHDPRKAHLDMRFFDIAAAPPFNFVFEKVREESRTDIFVENDGLDDQRNVIYLYHLKFPNHQGY